ncbi:MAG: DUF5678 domain-containing protein [Nitrospirota bacterium]
MSKKELDWISEHPKEIRKYSGKWIAVSEEKILAKGDSVKSVMQLVKKKQPKALPLVTKIPRKDEGMYIL